MAGVLIKGASGIQWSRALCIVATLQREANPRPARVVSASGHTTVFRRIFGSAAARRMFAADIAISGLQGRSKWKVATFHPSDPVDDVSEALSPASSFQGSSLATLPGRSVLYCSVLGVLQPLSSCFNRCTAAGHRLLHFRMRRLRGHGQRKLIPYAKR